MVINIGKEDIKIVLITGDIFLENSRESTEKLMQENLAKWSFKKLIQKLMAFKTTS